MRLVHPQLRFLVLTILFACRAGSSGEAPNQGAIQQTATGQILINLSSRGIQNDARITDKSLVVFYLYKKKDYSLNCTSVSDKKKCEDGLIFKNEKVDAQGFTNDPGYYGYDAYSNFYFPQLMADGGANYPVTKPADLVGYVDADSWQCIRNPFSGSPNYGKFECGVNPHPIKYFNRGLTTYTLQVYAAAAKGFPSWYGTEYDLFNSAAHPVKDGDKLYGYFAVYYSAMLTASDSENRFDLAASHWKRPVEPDLISPRVEITLKLQAEGAKDRAGSTYDIPDYSTWYDPFTSCKPTQSIAANSIYFSEFLWMGSKDVGGTSSSEDEFVEIYNSNSFDVVLSGWRLAGVGQGSAAVSLPNCTTIKAGSVFTVGTSTAKAFTKLDYATTAVALSNSGESALQITDAQGNVISSLSGCTTGPWGSAGVNGTAGNAKRSMRLTNINSPATSCSAGWTNTNVGDSNYGAASANLSTPYKASADTGVEGTVATPGFKGP